MSANAMTADVSADTTSRSNYRAKDALGLTLVPIAAQLDNRIPIHPDADYCNSHAISQLDFLRARLNTHWMVKCTHV